MTLSQYQHGVYIWISSISPVSSCSSAWRSASPSAAPGWEVPNELAYILSAVVAVGLLIYLIAALLNPEDFS